MITLNGNPINITMFPDKTSQVWKLPSEILLETNYARVQWNFENEGEFMHLAQLKMLLDRYGFKTDLIVPYFPYARQDKEINNNATFASNTFVDLLKHLNFNKIETTDIHSENQLLNINNLINKVPKEQINNAHRITASTILCYPDFGALSRYCAVGSKTAYIYANKTRNQLTGDIEALHLVKFDYNIENSTILIVDDICDGGGTFIKLAKLLYDNKVKEVNLYVSHGIFSKGIEVLKEAGIKRIFTKDGEIK